MATTIYKQGQGYYTRLISAIGFGLLILIGAVWIWNVFKGVKVSGVEQIYVSAAAAVIFTALFGGMLFYLVGLKPKVVDFMIATEGEMKKVHWSSRREVLGSTWVVIGLTVLIAALTFLCDLLFQRFFMWIHVLDA